MHRCFGVRLRSNWEIDPRSKASFDRLRRWWGTLTDVTRGKASLWSHWKAIVRKFSSVNMQKKIFIEIIAGIAKRFSAEIDWSFRFIRPIRLSDQLKRSFFPDESYFLNQCTWSIRTFAEQWMSFVSIIASVTSPMHILVNYTCARCIWHVRPFFFDSTALDYSRI